MTISNNFLKNFLQNFSIKKSPPFYRQEHIHDKKISTTKAGTSSEDTNLAITRLKTRFLRIF